MSEGSGFRAQGLGKARGLIVAGVMSGTSADGVDVAICRISPALREGGVPRVKVLGHSGFAYSKALRGAVLGAMDASSISVAELARLSWRLGEVYADCVEKACEAVGVETSAVALSRDAHLSDDKTVTKMGHPGSAAGLTAGSRLRLGLVGCHGQTVFHQGLAAKYLGKDVRCTWQMGEASVIAERLRVPVVSDFRPADLAAGGQGAPLVPMLDYVMFRSEKVNRILQNIGGMGNLTAIPAGAGVDGGMAFDTGPGNVVIDACVARLYGKAFDRGGAIGRRGRVLKQVVDGVLGEKYFSALPPKSCGREEFGSAFVDRFISVCRSAGGSDADVVATATALTAETVVEGYRRFVWAHLGAAAPLAKTEFVVAGGGVKNAALMGMLREGLEPLGVRVREMGELGVEAQAKEAVAFALLGWLTWNGMVGNVPTATGAARGVVLGKVTLG
jgi:anhydro-N-acetylmuramic acid kinase